MCKGVALCHPLHAGGEKSSWSSRSLHLGRSAWPGFSSASHDDQAETSQAVDQPMHPMLCGDRQCSSSRLISCPTAVKMHMLVLDCAIQHTALASFDLVGNAGNLRSISWLMLAISHHTATPHMLPAVMTEGLLKEHQIIRVSRLTCGCLVLCCCVTLSCCSHDASGPDVCDKFRDMGLQVMGRTPFRPLWATV